MRPTDSRLSYSQSQLADLSRRVLEHARALGATHAETEISEGIGQNVSVRLGEVETLEYNRDKGMGVTVYLGQKKGHAASSDLSDDALRDTVAAALAIAGHTASDPDAGLADPALQATSFPDLDLCHPWALSVDDAIELARETEAAARAVDARINNSEGGSVSSHLSQFVYANSQGFCQGYASTRHSLSAAVVASDGESMQRDYWYSSARHPEDLLPATEVGRMAGERTVRRLGGRQAPTGVFPVLFDPMMAAGLIDHFVSAASGGALYRKASFLVDTAGTQVFNPVITLEEDPFILRGMASGAFDNEGVATRARTVVEQGVLTGYFLSSYSARKLGLTSTGNAGGSHNLTLASTGQSFDELVRMVGRGLLVTELLGHGVNTVTGDYSRGAAGFWIENGEIAYPVEEITIAANLKDLYRGMIAVGTDRQVRGGKRTGSVLVERMTIAGQS